MCDENQSILAEWLSGILHTPIATRKHNPKIPTPGPWTPHTGSTVFLYPLRTTPKQNDKQRYGLLLVWIDQACRWQFEGYMYTMLIKQTGTLTL